MQPLQIYLLGDFRLDRGGRPLPPIASRGGRSLFAYLIMHRRRRHSRDELASTFWPDLAQPRRRLSHALWQIQDVLGELEGGERYLDATPETLGFNTAAPYWLDVEEFERRLRDVGQSLHRPSGASDLEELRAGVELYRGDFLSGFYDDWVVAEQERLREQYLGGLAEIVQLTKSQGRYDEALAYARRLSHHDPLREDIYRELMRLCVLVGRSSEALHEYERCRSVLAEELGTEPEAESAQLYHHIAQRRAAPPPASDVELTAAPGDLPLVGRNRELKELVDSLNELLAGRGGVVLVEGEPGVGKTRLLAEAARDAHWLGLRVLWATCEDVGTAYPYQALADAVGAHLTPLVTEQLVGRIDDVWLSEAARVVPALGSMLPAAEAATLRGADATHRMREALTRLLLGLAATNPTVVVLDDLHSADEETLDVLRTLSGRLDGSNLLLLITYRAHEARDRLAVRDVADALAQVTTRRLVLEPLSLSGTAQLVARATSSRTASTAAARLHQETGGNPLFVLETLRALDEAGELELLASTNGQVPVARNVQEIVTRRIGRLPPSAQKIAAVAAVMATSIDLGTLSVASGMRREDVADAVDVLVRADVLAGDSAAVAFRHSLLRRAVYEQLPEPRRRELHTRVGETLEATRPDAVELLARHFLTARRWRKALRYLQLAAERAQALHAHATAAAHYESAVACAERVPLSAESRFDLLAAAEDVLGLLGRRDAQDRVLERMDELAADDMRRRAEVRIRRAWWFAHSDRFADAERVARQALSLTSRIDNVQRRGAALTVLGTAIGWSGRPADAVPHLKAAVSANQHDPALQAESRWALGNVLRDLSRYDAAADELTCAYTLYQEADDAAGQANAMGALAGVYMETGRSAAAEACFRQALTRCRSIGFRRGEAVNLSNLAKLQYYCGDVAAAQKQLSDAVAACSGLGDRRLEAFARAHAANMRHRVLGEDDAASDDAEAALALAREIGNRDMEAECRSVLASIACRAGRLDEARERLGSSVSLARISGDRWVEVHVQRTAAQIALHGGRTDAALATLDAALRICEDFNVATPVAELVALRAAALLQLGRSQEALASTRATLDSPHSARGHRHLLHYWHARALQASGQDAEAAQAFTAAHDALLALLRGLPEATCRRAVEHVPEHRVIVAAWQAAQPRPIPISAPDADQATHGSKQAAEQVAPEPTIELSSDDVVVGNVRGGTHFPRSHEELLEWFPDDVECLDYLEWLRWPEGFVCPYCGSNQGWKTSKGDWSCGGCHRRVSVTTGTIFHRTRTPLTTWFGTAWYMTNQKTAGISAKSLQRALELGSYQTAWTMLHRFRSVMVRPGRELLSGTVEVDEALLETAAPRKPRRGAAGKPLVAVAVETRNPKGVGRARLRVVPDAGKDTLTRFIRECVEPGSEILTGGWGGDQGLLAAGYSHMPITAGSVVPALAPALAPAPAVRHVASLFKNSLIDAYQRYPDRHLQAYCDEWVFRFNRRTPRPKGVLFFELMGLAVVADPMALRRPWRSGN
jgi:DNA-binding SARP family transcriptional activator